MHGYGTITSRQSNYGARSSGLPNLHRASSTGPGGFSILLARMRKPRQVITPNVVFCSCSAPLPEPFPCPSTIQGWSLQLTHCHQFSILSASRQGQCHYFPGLYPHQMSNSAAVSRYESGCRIMHRTNNWRACALLSPFHSYLPSIQRCRRTTTAYPGHRSCRQAWQLSTRIFMFLELKIFGSAAFGPPCSHEHRVLYISAHRGDS